MRRSWLVSIAGAALLLAGCASTDSPRAPGSTAAGGDELTITVSLVEGNATTSTLTCDPPGGSHVDPAAACRVLAANVGALQPVGRGVACTQVYGGPETATITGTYGGDRVDSRLSRTNGCEIGRWAALVGLLPEPGRA